MALGLALGLVTSKQLGSPVFELSIVRAKRKVRTRTVYSAYYYYYKGANSIYAQYARAYHFLYGDHNIILIQLSLLTTLTVCVLQSSS